MGIDNQTLKKRVANILTNGAVVELVDTLDLVRLKTQSQIQWAVMPVTVRVRPALQNLILN